VAVASLQASLIFTIAASRLNTGWSLLFASAILVSILQLRRRRRRANSRQPKFGLAEDAFSQAIIVMTAAVAASVVFSVGGVQVPGAASSRLASVSLTQRSSDAGGDGSSSWAAPWCINGGSGLLCRTDRIRSSRAHADGASADLKARRKVAREQTSAPEMSTAKPVVVPAPVQLTESEAKVQNSAGFDEFKRLWSWTVEEGWLFGTGIFMVFAASATRSLRPIALTRVVSALSDAKFDARGLPEGLLRHRLLQLLVLGVVVAVLSGARGLCMGTVTARMLQKMRMRVYQSVLEQDLGWHDAREVGTLTSRVVSDCATVSESLTINFNAFLRTCVASLIGAGYLVYTSPQMSAFLVVLWVGMAFITNSYGRFTRRVAVQKQDKTASLTQAVNEDLSLIRVVRSYGLEDRQSQRFGEVSEDIKSLDMSRFRAYAGFLFSTMSLSGFMAVVTLFVGAVLVGKGRLTVPALLASVMYVREVVDSSFEAIDHFTSLQQTAGKAQRVFELLDAEDCVECIKPSGTSRILEGAAFRGEFELKNLSFSYPSRPAKIFDGLSLKLEAGKTTGLVGPSGSGKSTIVSLLQRLYEPTSDAASLTLDGVPLRDLDRTWLRQQMAVVTQDPRLFADTVFNNIAVGAVGMSHIGNLTQAVEDAAKKANAHDFIMELPEQYSTKVGDMKLLSGGQRQRVAIARALMRDPKILLLDEATSALDSQSEASVQAAIENVLKQGMTCIVIAHRLTTVRNADRIVVLQRGRVIESGNFQELLRRGGVFTKLAAEQSIFPSSFLPGRQRS